MPVVSMLVRMSTTPLLVSFNSILPTTAPVLLSVMFTYPLLIGSPVVASVTTTCTVTFPATLFTGVATVVLFRF